MVDELKQGENSWVDTTEQSDRVFDVDNNVTLMSESVIITDGAEPLHPQQPPPQVPSASSDGQLGISERAVSAAGAAFLSAVLVNPLDVVKTRLQAQAAGVAYSHPMSNMTSRMAVFGPNMMFADLRCSPSCTRAGVHGTVSICPADCFQYKGSLDVFCKIIRQTVQNQQRAEKDAALARLEQSRIILAMRLAEHQGKKYKFIEEAQSLVGDVRNASQFASPENLYDPATSAPGENLTTQMRKRSNALFNMFFSSLNFFRKSLRVDEMGGILGNAALVAISMFALMHLQQVGSKEKYLLDLPLGQDVNYNRNTKKLPQPEGPSSGLGLDVLSARG